MINTFLKIHELLIPSQRKAFLLLLGLVIIGVMLETLGIGMVIPSIAVLIQDDIVLRYPMLDPMLNWLGNPSQQKLVMIAMLALVAVYVVKSMYLAFLAWWRTRFVLRIQVQLSQRLFTSYMFQPYTFHLQRNSALLIRNISSEVSMFTNMLTSTMVHITECMVLFCIGALLFIVEPVGSLIVVLVLGAIASVFYRITRGHVTRWGKERQFHDGLRIKHLQQGLGGAKDVKLLGREENFLEQYLVHNTQSARMTQRHSTLQQMPRLFMELLAVAALAILVMSMLAQKQDMSIIVTTLGLFTAAAFRLLPSVNQILVALQGIRFGLPVLDNLREEIKLEIPEQPSHTNHAISELQTEISLSSISYTYHGAAVPALSDIFINIKKGEYVGFIGPSGSGKSTLVDVFLGLLTPNMGQVVVDNKNIQQNLRAWQDQIGYVPQSIYLTDDTLRRNVAFGISNEQIDDVAVKRAIKAAQLEEFVANLPDGMETVVGERGIRLSGGQRQRIGIARALYHDPAVLVLDEATSSLDSATELGVMQTVTKLQGSKTILIVAHRLSTVEHCSRLYQLEQGSMIAEGTPAEILRAV